MKNFKSYVDLETWKHMQTSFAKTINQPLITISIKGEVIHSTNSLPFFCEVLQSKKYCDKNYLEIIQAHKQSGEKILHSDCKSGLLIVSAPIRVDKQLIGIILCCSLKTEKPQAINSYLNIDQEELRDGFKAIPNADSNDIAAIGKLLSVLADTVPELARQKLLGDQKLNALEAIHDFTRLTSASLDEETIIKSAIRFLVKHPNVVNCSIVMLSKKKRYCYDPSISSDSEEPVSAIKSQQLKEFFLVSVPLFVHDVIQGVLYVYTKTEISKPFYETIANQIAMAISNARQYQQIHILAETDQLTRLYNRHYFMKQLYKEIKKKPFSLLLLDIDDFKHYNDHHGHVHGDALLTELGEVLNLACPRGAIIGRYGGEEFIIALPETNNGIANDIAEVVRKKVAEHDFSFCSDQPLGCISVSMGVATCLDPKTSVEQLLRETDKMLYKAKAAGKNCFESAIIVNKDLSSLDTKEIQKHHSSAIDHSKLK